MSPIASPPTGQSHTNAARHNTAQRNTAPTDTPRASSQRSQANPRSTSVRALGPAPRVQPAPRAHPTSLQQQTLHSPTPPPQPPNGLEISSGSADTLGNERASRGAWFFVVAAGVAAVVCLSLLLTGGSDNKVDVAPTSKGTNGALAQSDLAEISGGHLLTTQAAQAFGKLSAAMKDAGISFTVNSAYRSVAQQQALVDDLGLLEDGGKAAPVGTSEHGWGTAVDMTLDWDGVEWLREHAGAYGFKETISGEPWHWNFVGK